MKIAITDNENGKQGFMVLDGTELTNENIEMGIPVTLPDLSLLDCDQLKVDIQQILIANNIFSLVDLRTHGKYRVLNAELAQYMMKQIFNYFVTNYDM